MSREGQERVCFYLDEDVKREFHALCVKTRISMSDALRIFVKQALIDAQIRLEQQGGEEE